MSETLVEIRDVCLRYRTRLSLFRHDTFTALDQISFDIFRGETLGIVGSNGSGKSTLLKLIANIFSPDSGTITWHCRQASLLSLAIGFDAQLSGRDNVVISGMLLGARKSDILEKLDEIIEFSELGGFIDKPIKTYSTGMRARLGFAVAIKMHSDLLLIDEVLGVGDNTFKKKASEAMIDKISSQQTVVIVSHSVSQLESLCSRVLWLERGKINMLGEPGPVLAAYQGRTRT